MFPMRKAEGAGPVHPGKEMAQGRSYQCVQVSEGCISREWSQIVFIAFQPLDDRQ